MLVRGEWRKDAYQLTNEDGEFDRDTTSFRDKIGDEDYPAEGGRYHLYICRACPWAHRTAMTRRLKGLDDQISLSLVQPERYDEGWEFNTKYSDPLYDNQFLREAYVRADKDYTGRVTVPVLWDKKTETIVNNESEEIMRMMDTEFQDLDNGVDLYPEGYRDEVDSLISEIYGPINNGVYRAGFAESQEAYENAVEDVFDALDRWDDVLDSQRFLAGDRLTEADVAMFPTLVRFDKVYHTHFKCNKKHIYEYENLWNYTKDIYQIQGIEETVNMDHITRHYYKSHGGVNPKRLVGVGPDLDFNSDHNRSEKFDAELPSTLQ